MAQPRKLSAEDKGRKAPYDRLLGQAFARVVETYDVDNLPRHGGHGTTVFITMSVDDLRKDRGTAALGFDGEQITAARSGQPGLPSPYATHGICAKPRRRPDSRREHPPRKGRRPKPKRETPTTKSEDPAAVREDGRHARPHRL